MRGVYQANLDIGILQETKITDGVYTHSSYGYSIIAKDDPSRHCGGVAVLYQESPSVIKAIQKFGPNVVIFYMVMGGQQWYIIIC